jgi:integrase
VSSFDVRIFAIRRRLGRQVFEVRWRVAARDKSGSFMTRALADSYRAELIRAARRGLEFDSATGEPLAWAVAKPVTVTWYQHAVAYAAMKWPHLAAHSRASMAEALATVTPLLTRTATRRPPARTLRAALYGYAFNPPRRSQAPGPATASVLAWLERHSLPVSCLSDPAVVRAALDGLCQRLDGTPAAANTITRKRAVFHNALGYAVERGLLPANPAGTVPWHAPRAAAAVSPQAVASPAQVQAILAQVALIRRDLVAFFACLYYAALRPEEAVALRAGHLTLPACGRGSMILTGACPRTAAAWTGNGRPHEPRGLKHRPDGAIRIIPIPPILVCLLRQHIRESGTAPDGRLFRGTRGGPLSESVYGRVWRAARQAALGPALAPTGLARRPYDLRHAALSLWLNASAAPAEVAARAGTSVHVLESVYTHCISGQQDAISQRIEDALGASSRTPQRPPPVTASGSPDRLHRPESVRHLSVHGPLRAAQHQPDRRNTRTHLRTARKHLPRSEGEFTRSQHGPRQHRNPAIWSTHSRQAVRGTARSARKSR